MELRLKILSAAAAESKGRRGGDATVDALAYRGALARLARCMRLTDASFMEFLRHVCRLRDVDAQQAIGALDDFLEAKLFDHGQAEHVEQAVVTRISITAMAGNAGAAAEDLTAFLDRVGRNLKSTLSEEASTGAVVLVWKVVEREVAQKNCRIAMQLCRVARHPVFENCCELNKAVVARKMMLCALADNDSDAAREAFFLMSKPSQENPLSRYLLYKAALRSGDDALGRNSDRNEDWLTNAATECLDDVARASSKDGTLLYGCILEAQKAGHRKQAIQSFQKLVNDSHATPNGLHLPALLRYLLTLAFKANLSGVLRN
jgi:hypothetical protein